MGLMNEYIQRGLSSNDLEKELLLLIAQYNKIRDSFLFVYSAAISKQVPAASLNMDDYYIIFDLLNSVKSKKIDFYIETPGGSGEAAEEIVRFLHKKFRKVTFLVSGEAKSAGTIMALSGNDIYMTNSGSLGPIDAQVRIGRSTVSAYDYMHWIEEKRLQAEKDQRLNPFDATMVAQISPGELNGVDNALNFAKDIVVEWLQKYKFKNWNRTNEQKRKRAEEIVESLLNHKKWRSHGRSLKTEDLERLGLKIKHIDNNAKLSDIVYRIQTVVKLLFGTTSTYKIYATESDKIFAQATSVNVPVNVAPKDVQTAQFEVKCPKCGRVHKIYAKFVLDKQLDENMQAQGFTPFPKTGKIMCDCGFEIDLTGIKNDAETQVGKKILV